MKPRPRECLRCGVRTLTYSRSDICRNCWRLGRASDAIDEIAIELACDGHPARLTPAERARAIARLTARGASTLTISDTLHMHPRSVTRIRAYLRSAS